MSSSAHVRPEGHSQCIGVAASLWRTILHDRSRPTLYHFFSKGETVSGSGFLISYGPSSIFAVTEATSSSSTEDNSHSSSSCCGCSFSTARISRFTSGDYLSIAVFLPTRCRASPGCCAVRGRMTSDSMVRYHRIHRSDDTRLPVELDRITRFIIKIPQPLC